MNPPASPPAVSEKTDAITRQSSTAAHPAIRIAPFRTPHSEIRNSPRSEFRIPQSAFAPPSYFTLSTFSVKAPRAFTLIELLVVITIIIILMGLLFPAFRGVQDQAKRTQAKNDLTQIVTAVNAYYTEYGKYPLAAQGDDAQAIFTTDNSDVINTLRAVASGANAGDALNPRKIVFITPPDVKDPANPRSGVTAAGKYFDPWGAVTGQASSGIYHVAIDGDYNNTITNPYGANTGAGGDPIRQGVIAWSLGKDGALGNAGAFTNSDDVISWQ